MHPPTLLLPLFWCTQNIYNYIWYVSCLSFSGWVVDEKVEEEQAVRMSYCE